MRKSHQMTRVPFVSLWDEAPQGNSQVLLFSWGVTVVPRHQWIPRMLIYCTRCYIFWECVHVPQLLACSRDVHVFPRCWMFLGH